MFIILKHDYNDNASYFPNQNRNDYLTKLVLKLLMSIVKSVSCPLLVFTIKKKMT